jgi:2-polyprenyl-3-methyl-5-hydroxy-6-metoxy-1,4-benzoquinol methylase
MFPLESRSRAAYESWHPQVQSDAAEADRPWHRLVFKHLQPEDLTGRRVLEIGCGRGELACRISSVENGPRQFVAADFSQSALRLGRSRADRTAIPQPSWLVASIQDVAVSGSVFDTVISCETVEHLADPQRALREIQRVLRPGGRLLLTTPNYLGPLGLYRGYLRVRGRRYTEGGQPICRLTSLPRTLLWVWRAGLRVIEVDAVGHYLPWPGQPPRELAGLDDLRPLRWFALHSLVVAERPSTQ